MWCAHGDSCRGPDLPHGVSPREHLAAIFSIGREALSGNNIKREVVRHTSPIRNSRHSFARPGQAIHGIRHRPLAAARRAAWLAAEKAGIYLVTTALRPSPIRIQKARMAARARGSVRRKVTSGPSMVIHDKTKRPQVTRVGPAGRPASCSQERAGAPGSGPRARGRGRRPCRPGAGRSPRRGRPGPRRPTRSRRASRRIGRREGPPSARPTASVSRAGSTL